VGTDVFYGAIHEFGGTFARKAHTMKTTAKFGGRVGLSRGTLRHRKIAAGTVTFPKRPFMGPALDAVRPKIPQIVVRNWKREGGI
jgi:phage gpG-like protein